MRNFDQGKGNLVRVSGEFELSEFELSRFYCNLNFFEEVKNSLRRIKGKLGHVVQIHFYLLAQM